MLQRSTSFSNAMADSTAAAPLHPKERGALDGTMPFRTVYIAFRAVVIGLEVATLGYLIWMSAAYSNRTGHYACGIVAVRLTPFGRMMLSFVPLKLY